MTYTYVLLPGRHHAITRFQVAYLRSLLAGAEDATDGQPVVCAPDVVVVWAVTSSSHEWTRRNPLPGPRRAALIERVAASADLPSVVVSIPDVPQHPRFADLVLTTTSTELSHLPELTPQNTVVACSTPEVAGDYVTRGYRIAPVEAARDPRPAGPWQVVEWCGAGDDRWRGHADPETAAYYERYGFDVTIPRLMTDPTVGAEGDLTETRDYRTYAASFESASRRKWSLVGPHLMPGRVVDIGCATGGLLEQVAADPAFAEADLFGIDLARPLLAEAEHKKAAGVFGNPNIWFVRANVLTGPVMPQRSVASTVSIALTHEIVSYSEGGLDDLETFARRIYDHTRPGGVWVNSDVVGPEDPDRLVTLELAADDQGSGALDRAMTDLDGRPAAQVQEVVSKLSTNARMVQFAHDFPRLSGAEWHATRLSETVWELTLRDAMEFMTRKDYVDNWLSECHERFCALSYPDWADLLEGIGFTLDVASSAHRNEWLVENRFNPCAQLRDATSGEHVSWPSTHVLTVARRATALEQREPGAVSPRPAPATRARPAS